MSEHTSSQTGTGSSTGRLAVYWLVVGIPLVYGLEETVRKAAALFTG